ncbi:MAG: hypothetical protein J3R72DRAFT_435756 [Linnemannia gamsii]|nr:MAG: hypothetical protein J3R72DRAFT_435756 [Linnemannia gamsii]
MSLVRFVFLRANFVLTRLCLRALILISWSSFGFHGFFWIKNTAYNCYWRRMIKFGHGGGVDPFSVAYISIQVC